MEILSLIFNFVLLIFLYLLFLYIKKIPDKIHQKSIKKFEFDLNKKLEEFKSELSKQIEIFKITQSQIQFHKTQEFIKLIEYFNKIITDKKFTHRLTTNPKEQENFNKKMLDLGVKLFFFASDETVKKYIEWRLFGINSQDEQHIENKTKLVLLYAELIVLIRKDLGYENTKCNSDDFLNIILKDWEDYKKKINIQ